MKMVALGEVLVKRAGTVDPSKFPDEKFDLYSIPAFDRGVPDLASGCEIGSAKQVVQPGDVLLSRIVPHIRRSWVVGDQQGRRIIASGEWMVFRSDMIHPPWLRHILLGDHFHQKFMATVAGVGGSLMRARPAHVANIEIPLPPLPEQRRIAAILDHADALRAKRRKVIGHLDGIAQSIFLDMFGDPAEYAASGNCVALGEVADLQGGRNLVADDDQAASSFRVLKISAVTTGTFKPTESKPLPPDYIPPPEHMVRRGDLLISRANTTELVGAVAYVDQEPTNVALPDKVWRFVWADPESVPLFYWTLFRTPSIRRRISQLSSGTGGSMKNISKAKLDKLELPAVSPHQQREFARRMAAIPRVEADQFDTLFASLQSRAFRGEL